MISIPVDHTSYVLLYYGRTYYVVQSHRHQLLKRNIQATVKNRHDLLVDEDYIEEAIQTVVKNGGLTEGKFTTKYQKRARLYKLHEDSSQELNAPASAPNVEQEKQGFWSRWFG